MKVLITGGSRGIGEAICQKFIESGYLVIAPTRGELDLNNAQSVDSFIASHLSDNFEIIICNAGINEINIIDKVSDEELQSMININLISHFKLIRAFVPAMKREKFGRIVNIGSIWAVVSKSGRSVYSMAKNALHGLTNALAVELGEFNILVNTVCPGFTLTELTRKNNTQEDINILCKDIPLGRMAMPHEIANLVYFLACKDNTYITGQKIVIDGGFTVK